MPTPISTRELLSEKLLHTGVLRPLLPIIKCLSTSLNRKTPVQVDTCCTGMCVIAIHTKRIKPSKKANCHSSGDQGVGKGREATGCCSGQGVGSMASGQQLARKGAAKQPRCLLLKEGGDCREGVEPAASDVSCCWRERSWGVSAQCPLPTLCQQGGEGTRKLETPQDRHHLQSLLQGK